MSSKPKDTRSEPGHAEFDELGWGGGPKHLLRELVALWCVYRNDQSTNIAAFEAMERIAVHCWDDDVQVDRPDPNFGMAPETMVSVPWWVVHLLGRSWRNYRTSGPGKNAERAFLLTEPGQGKRPRIDTFNATLQRRLTALSVAVVLHKAECAGDKCSVESAIGNVTANYGIPEDTVRDHWKAHGREARATLAEHLKKGGNFGKSPP